MERDPPSPPAAPARARRPPRRSLVAAGILGALVVLAVIRDSGDLSRLVAGDVPPTARDRADPLQEAIAKLQDVTAQHAQLLQALQRNQTEHRKEMHDRLNEMHDKLSHLSETAGSPAASPELLSKTARAPAPTSKLAARDFGHYLMHIPKTGTSYAYIELGRLVSSGSEPPRTVPCNMNTKPLEKFDEKFTRIAQGGRKCDMWMTERPYSDRPRNTYAILRDPRSHTLSMYFHCAESEDHRGRARFMPSLDEWLKVWVDAKRTSEARQEFLRRRTRCYNPINPQLRFIGNPTTARVNQEVFHSKLANAGIMNATSAARIKHRNGNPSGTQYLVSPEDLRKRYAVLGDQSQMDKSICMIQIHYKGYVTAPCDCTNATATAVGDVTNDATRRVDHGVTHHGDSFETTREQDDMIAVLRDYDTALYEQTREIFAAQVRETEERYGVKICDKITMPTAKRRFVTGK